MRASGLSSYELTKEEEAALDLFDNDNYFREYGLGEMFVSHNGNFDIKKSHINDNGNWVVTAGTNNHGILGKTDVGAKIFPPNTITIDMFGAPFYRPFQYKMVTHARVFNLEPTFEINSKIGLFLCSSLHFLSKEFSYSNMCSWNKIKHKTIPLPTKNNAPDFIFMSTFISAISKLVIKDVVDFAASKISAYERVIKQNKQTNQI